MLRTYDNAVVKRGRADDGERMQRRSSSSSLWHGISSTEFAARYDNILEVGDGSMAFVVAAFRNDTKRTVLLKIHNARSYATVVREVNMTREARSHASVRDNVVEIYDVFYVYLDGTHREVKSLRDAARKVDASKKLGKHLIVIEEEYVEGRTLASAWLTIKDTIVEERRREGVSYDTRKTFNEALALMRDVVRVAAQLNAVANIRHGDFHTDNVMLRAGSDAVVLIDFGVACDTRSDSMQQHSDPATWCDSIPDRFTRKDSVKIINNMLTQFGFDNVMPDNVRDAFQRMTRVEKEADFIEIEELVVQLDAMLEQGARYVYNSDNAQRQRRRISPMPQ